MVEPFVPGLDKIIPGPPVAQVCFIIFKFFFFQKNMYQNVNVPRNTS
jgi:hypothetical protein